MKAIVSNKDVCRIEVYASTDVAGISLWSDINVGEGINVNTGTDGNFKVILCFNQSIDPDENRLIHKSERGVKLNLGSKLYMGSTEWKNSDLDNIVSQNIVDEITIPEGGYVLDVYSLVVTNELNDAKYLQLAFCLFSEESYVDKSIEVHQVDSALEFGY